MNSFRYLNILLFIFLFNIIIICICLEDTINTNDLDESAQCFYQEKDFYKEKEEIIYEIINNNFNKTLFIQFKSVDSITIY